MSTINGVSFNLQNLSIVSSHRNVISTQPGSDTNYITDMGYEGLVLRLNGFETSLATYDAVIAEFMKSGEQTLVHRTGWQYKVYSTQLNPILLEGIVANFFPYELILITSTPYRESTSETTRSKTITTNNQEWSADNAAADILTSGNVDAVPDIQVTGELNNAVLISQTVYDYSWGAASAGQTFSPQGTYITSIAVRTRYDTFSAWDCTMTVYDSFAQNTVMGSKVVNFTAVNTVYTFVFDTPIKIVPGLMYFRLTGTPNTCRISGSSTDTYTPGSAYNNGTIDPNSRDMYMVIYADYEPVKDITIYNIADPTIKLALTNDVLSNAIHRINVDGTGTVYFADDFSTARYSVDSTRSGVSYDYINDEVDIADDGYIYWPIDTKDPITGIPTLTAQINVTAGTPTIQISTDATTWYNIDTAIVDDVDTIYELDNATSLSLKGLTTFYWRIDCVKVDAATCSVKSFELDVALVTIDVEHPKIVTGAVASTFRCDQDVSSGMACIVALIYRDRSWPV